jgi:hypothetical protein
MDESVFVLCIEIVIFSFGGALHRSPIYLVFLELTWLSGGGLLSINLGS